MFYAYIVLLQVHFWVPLIYIFKMGCLFRASKCFVIGFVLHSLHVHYHKNLYMLGGFNDCYCFIVCLSPQQA